MKRFVVGSFLLALVELIGFAAYTATHRIEAGVVAVRPDRHGSHGSSVLTRAPASRSRSPVPSRQSTSALPDNGARANPNASLRAIKHADPAFFEGFLAWESSLSLPCGCALIAASTGLDDRPGPARDYLGYHHASHLVRDPDASESVLRAFESLLPVPRAAGLRTLPLAPP